MDVFKLFTEAANAFNRVVQQAEEKLLNAEKTDFDDEYLGNLKKLHILQTFTEKIIDETEAMLEPNPAYRIEGKILEKVDRVYDRATPLENLGAAFESAARAIKEYSPHLNEAFTMCGKYQTKIGSSSKEFQNRCNEVYVAKLKKMLDIDLKRYQDSADALENLRLDHDSLKIRIKKAITVAGKDALEQEFIKVKDDFDAQYVKTTEFFKDIDKFFDIHSNLLKDFVESESRYYIACHRELEKFKVKLDGKYAKCWVNGGSYYNGSTIKEKEKVPYYEEQ